MPGGFGDLSLAELDRSGKRGLTRGGGDRAAGGSSCALAIPAGGCRSAESKPSSNWQHEDADVHERASSVAGRRLTGEDGLAVASQTLCCTGKYIVQNLPAKALPFIVRNKFSFDAGGIY